jgi:mRNA interferase HigB
MAMRIISRKRLRQFVSIHPDADAPLEHWYKTIKSSNIGSFDELRSIFPSADRVNDLTVFNIGGNKFRLIAAMHYNTKRIYIQSVLTHDEYIKGKWKG